MGRILDAKRDMDTIATLRAELEAMKAELARLKDRVAGPTPGMIEDGVFAYNLIGIAGGIVNTAEDHVEYIWNAMATSLTTDNPGGDTAREGGE